MCSQTLTWNPEVEAVAPSIFRAQFPPPLPFLAKIYYGMVIEKKPIRSSPFLHLQPFQTLRPPTNLRKKPTPIPTKYLTMPAASSLQISFINANLRRANGSFLPITKNTISTRWSISNNRRAALGLKSNALRRRSLMILNAARLPLERRVSNERREGEAALRVGIVGFGNFGQFIAKGIQRQGHIVLATSRSDYSDYCGRHGIRFFRSVDEMCEEELDVVLVCSSILSTEAVVRGIPTHKLRRDTIFADVLSVKQLPKNLFLEVLPPEFGIVCTHPMYGPESGKGGWAGLPFVFDKVRVSDDNSIQAQKCTRFLNIFEQEGCRMVEMSCEEHDRHAASSQFITHTIGRILSELNLESTPINTKGYETLLKLTENTVKDSFDLYSGLFMFNVNATEQLENLDRAFGAVKTKLFGSLQEILRKQIAERIPMEGTPPRMTDYCSQSSYFLPDAKKIKDLSSFVVTPLPTQVNRTGQVLISQQPARAGVIQHIH